MTQLLGTRPAKRYNKLFYHSAGHAHGPPAFVSPSWPQLIIKDVTRPYGQQDHRDMPAYIIAYLPFPSPLCHMLRYPLFYLLYPIYGDRARQ